MIGDQRRTRPRRFERRSIPFRYVWPSELDLMARLAGMALRERWSSWRRDPFHSESLKHISVWERLIVIRRRAVARRVVAP